ncbi:double-strand-break repair protein rad21 homolog [Uloborus diversus]|uniref:double-strand-break repair protein rad21 homolog n=1 Tax=Uloborus diversus TaxID=327109 RepID=UPI0024098068|nr:double-strand-break repair protein rad21 homolog [Uloborus diversus]
MPQGRIDMDASINLNQSRAEDITLKEDYGSLTLMADDAFGKFDDMAFDEPETARDATNIDEGFHASLLLCDETKEPSEETVERENAVESETSNNTASKVNVSIDASLKNDGFGNTLGEGLLDAETGSLFEPAGLFDDAPLDHVSLENAEENASSNLEKQPGDGAEKTDNNEDSDDDMYDMGPASMGAPSPPSSPDSPRTHVSAHESATEMFREPNGGPLDLAEEPFLPPGNTGAHTSGSGADICEMPGILNELEPSGPASALPFDHHKLIAESESFALGPLDSIMEGSERIVKAKRKRKLIVDETKNISGEEMKLQLSDTSDIIISLDLAPPTKRLMYWKETGGVEKLFSLPGHIILSKTLSKAYQMHLTTRSVENENFGGLDEDLIDLDTCLEEARERDETVCEGTVSRKRRRDEDPMLPPENLPSHLDSLPPYSDSLTHPSFEVANFLQSHHQHMFPPNASSQIPEPQMMSNVMSVMSHQPQAHMIQQMLQPDVDQERGPPLHTINPSLHNSHTPHPPVVSEAYNQGLPSTSYGAYVTERDNANFVDKKNENMLPESGEACNSANLLFDSLNDGELSHSHTIQNNNVEDHEKKNNDPFPLSDDDDYGAPPSVGPLPEQQMDDETYEQFEERILMKRTTHMLHYINQFLDRDEHVKFSELARGNKRKQVAQKFYTFLVLKKLEAVELEHNKGDLLITRGLKYNAVYNGQ